MTKEQERALALMVLLRLPDPPELVDRRGRPRGHHVTQRRRTFADTDRAKRDLARAYVVHRQQERGEDISCVVSRRRGALKMVRRA